MRRNLLYIALCATSLWAMTACSDDAIVQEKNEDVSGRSPIELSAGVSNGNFNDMLTRAIITDGTGKTKRAFEKATNLFFIVKAEHATDNSKTTKWGYNYATAAAATDAQKDNGAIKANTKSSITFYDNYLYWDDAYARDTKVSVYSIGAANYERTDIELSGSKKIGSSSGYNKIIPFETPSPDPTHTLTWTIGDNSHADWQTKGSISQQDLVFSNNITKHSDTEDQRLKFNTETGDKYHKFDKGDLIFYHALTKFTIQIKCGDGFKGDGTDFKFSNSPSGANNSFAMNGFYGKAGTFNIVNGEFATCDDNNKQDFSSIYLDTDKTSAQKTNPYYTLYAYVIPGTDMTGTKSDAFSFEIDNNKFYISLAQLYNAIKNGATNVAKTNSGNNVPSSVDVSILGSGKTLLPGVNYEFTFTVNKTKIDVTASIKDWEDVSATNETPIINISKCYGQEGSNFQKVFTFYRSTTVDGSFLSGITEGNKTNVSYDATNGYKMSSQLYWPDHSTHYFFRSVWPVEGTAEQTSLNNAYVPSSYITHNANNKTQIAVQNVAYKQETFPSDLMIGMPRNTDGTPDETCKAGHKDSDNNAIKGICATDAATGATHDNEGLIHMNFQYAMSQVIVELKTNSADGAHDKVTFDGNTKVEIVDGYTEGAILFGTQASDFTGKSVNTYEMNRYGADVHTKFHNAIIPQPLSNGTGENVKDLKFRITVGSSSNHDVYETVLGIKSIKVKEGNTDKYITSWEPGKKYTYTLYITKTDIKVTATLTDWVDVSASDNIWF